MLSYLLDMNVIKKISILERFCLMAVLLFAMAACSEKEEAVAPAFPEKEIVEAVTPGAEHTLSFTANMNWKVTSSALWCKFSNGLTSISGEAGEISLLLTITDEALSVNELTVDITLIMGNEEKVIARYIRTGKDLIVMDVDGNAYNENHKLMVSYSNNNTIEETFSLVSNFAWELKEAPEWLTIDLPLKVKANQEFNLPVQLNNNFLTDAHEGVLRFYEQHTDRYYDVPVAYEGMPEGTIRVDGIGSAWNWTVALDGSQYWQEDQNGGEVEKKSFPLSFKVFARNNEYVIRSLGQASDGWMNINENIFYQYEDDRQGNITLSNFQENTGAKRKGYILVFPKKDYDEISHQGTWSDENTLLDGADISSSVEKYVVMSFEQEGGTQSSGLPEVSQIISDSHKISLLVEQGFGENATEALKNKFMYGDIFLMDQSQIYNLEVESGAKLEIKPLLQDAWGELYLEDCSFLDAQGNALNDKPEDYLITGESSAERCITFTCNQPMVILFQGEYSMTYKALIITLKGE